MKSFWGNIKRFFYNKTQKRLILFLFVLMTGIISLSFVRPAYAGLTPIPIIPSVTSPIISTPNPTQLPMITSVPIANPSPFPVMTVIPLPSISIKISAPNGGETLIVGQTFRIRWASNKIDKVTLGYKSCPSCLDWIVNNIPNNNYYDWTVNVGNTANTKFKIYIIGYETGVGSVTDESDNEFTVIKQTPLPTSTPSPKRPPCGEYGDVDFDRWVTKTDAQWVMEYDVGLRKFNLIQKQRADVNGDKKADVVDALFIQRYVSGLNQTFPVCRVTPTPTSKPIPTSTTTPTQSKISWNTPYVSLEADDFYITANGKKYFGKAADLILHSDPGNKNYTTLEATWHENGVEMRMYMYFNADNSYWWSPEIRTYNGKQPGDWTVYTGGLFFRTFIGNSYMAPTWDLYKDMNNPYADNIHFTNLKVRAFTNTIMPTYTPTPTPIKVIPTNIPWPTAVIVTPTVIPNRKPEITSFFLPWARVNKNYSAMISGYDLDKTDNLNMKITNLPTGISQGPCWQAVVNGRKSISCNISGKPQKTGSYFQIVYYLGVTLEDNRGGKTQRTIPLVVLPK